MSDIPSAEDLDRVAEEEEARRDTARMKVAYVAGPYRAPTQHGVVENIHAAAKVGLKYWKLGYAVICPHVNTSLFDGLAEGEAWPEDDVWLRGDLELLRRCDVVVAMPEWRKSSGATAEIARAVALNIPVIYEKE